MPTRRPGSGSGGWRVTPEMWRTGLRRTYGLLSRAGIPTISIRDIPQAGFDAPGCLSRSAARTPFGNNRRCEFSLADGIVPSARAARTDAARGLRNIGFVEMADRMCDRGRCSVVRRSAIVFRDDDHLSATFSRAEGPELGRRIGAVFAQISGR